MLNLPAYVRNSNFYEENGACLHIGFFRQVVALLFLAVMSVCITACGGGGGSGVTQNVVNNEADGLSISGKVVLENGNPLSNTAVNIYKATYQIYTTSIGDTVHYMTRDTSGLESVKEDSAPFKAVNTDLFGNYKLSGLLAGSYTIRPKADSYVFSWGLVPVRSSGTLVTITESGMVYIYDPDETNNKLSADGTVIYNIGDPFSIADSNILSGQNFKASASGGVDINL
ncbi:MAG: hypothetical protein PHN84_06400 [Desulfuromonadaceae bacterium]|nr:hypothetical protein [Desulfuromonadaceae bacterium]MDD2855389.1 hypothetical protein [Desulfuromonadaceae bacterium]